MQTSKLINQLDAAFDMRKAGNYVGALSKFESLERQSVHPQDVAALRFFQATCLTDMGRPEDALKQISQVDKSKLIFSKQVDYEYERARIERALGHKREALDRVGNALEMANTVDDKQEVSVVVSGLQTLQGILLAESGRCGEALPILEAVPMDDEGWAEVRIHLGDCKYKEKLYQEAIDYYLSVTSGVKKVHPFYREGALRNIGFAYYDLGQYESAVEYLTKIADAYDDSPDMRAEVLGILATAHAHLGNSRKAEMYRALLGKTGSVQ